MATASARARLLRASVRARGGAAAAAAFLSACSAAIAGPASDGLVITAPAGAREDVHVCRRGAVSPCDLRLYQVMVSAFVDGSPDHGYGAGYGPSRHEGDLAGVMAGLDHIAGLGVNALWLTPIFDSRAGEPMDRLEGDDLVNLRLDATGYYPRDYFSVDPRLGALEDAWRLVEAAHARGLHVIFDAPFGHHKGAVAPAPSGLVPVDSRDPADYGGSPADAVGRVVDFSAPDSVAFYEEVAAFWVDALGVDGWRLDQAYQVPPHALRAIGAAVDAAAARRRAAGEGWGVRGYRVAEVFKAAPEIAAIFGDEAGPAVGSAFDFPTRYALVQVLAGDESGLAGAPASTLAADWAMGAHALYPPHAAPNLMLGNHDVVRFGDLLQRAGVAEPGDDAYWARHRLAFAFMAAYSGPITLFYGEELGLEVPGYADQVVEGCAERDLCDDHVARMDGVVPGVTVAPEELAPEALALRDHVARLMGLRAARPALYSGARTHLFSDETLYVDLKSLGEARLILVMNVGSEARKVTIAAPALAMGEVTGAADLIWGAPAAAEAQGVTFTAPGLTAMIIEARGRAEQD
ncbi:MAG: alpha-amylase family glycosyl hydrolase [Caulobacterales bacterium]|nr:alpha-amylase family glycosyl hydrolase [Caulobacterales bacterium]